jgi:two-component system chemotaxis sensor kinase CheA
MLEVYIYENQQLLETLESVMLKGEKDHALDDEQINEVFRIMHTIKGSSSMMNFEELAKLSHAVEDLFSQIRDKRPRSSDWDNIFDIVLTANDCLKGEIEKLQKGQSADAEFSTLIDKIHVYLFQLTKRKTVSEAEDDFDSGAMVYKIKVSFEEGCMMESTRAFGLVTALAPHAELIQTEPANLDADSASEEIVRSGLVIFVKTAEDPEVLREVVGETMFIEEFSLIQIEADSLDVPEAMRLKKAAAAAKSGEPVAAAAEGAVKQNFISVNVSKLDKLMDLVGELVTTESMVTKNPEITKLQIEGFDRSSQELRKLINELQDTVMSIRMVPVSTTFHKMHRIVRDVSKKVGKDVELEIIGEETEVDKNIIELLSDPLMHLIRNSVDHGIEMPDVRRKKGKGQTGHVTLEARNTGGDVILIVSDDGDGLNRSAIIKKAIEQGLTSKSESEISDKEAFSFVMLPGFSTNTEVTEYSGRGVGMDVVKRNIDKVGGTISIESEQGVGTSTTIRIPLTLAIIEGMKLRVGNLVFIVPLLSIQESFKPNIKDVFLDPNGKEMIMIRNQSYSVMRLHNILDIESEFKELSDGILIMINTESDTYCLFVDELIGEQQAVIKPLPPYIKKHNHGLSGIGGCAVLGDGSICLIIDINNLVI